MKDSTTNFELTNMPLDITITPTSEQGLRWSWVKDPETGVRKKERKEHTGIDLHAPLNTPVYATHDGTVIKAGFAGKIGRVITIKDKYTDVITMYYHLNSFDVKYNDPVVSGQQIGLSGDGRPTRDDLSPHLHFDIVDGSKKYLGKTVFNSINDAGKADLTIQNIKLGTLGIDNSVPRLDARYYLSNLATTQALAEHNQKYNSNESYDNLSPTNKALIDKRSCQIFTCRLNSRDDGINLKTDDIRDNTLISNSNNNELDGGTGSNIFSFTTGIKGADTISDLSKTGTILLYGTTLSTTASPICDSITKEASTSSWQFTHTGSDGTSKNYIAKRINSATQNPTNQESTNGANLRITLESDIDDSNSLTIEDFDFDNGGYGITLSAGDSNGVKSEIEDSSSGGQSFLKLIPLTSTTSTSSSANRFLANWYDVYEEFRVIDSDGNNIKSISIDDTLSRATDVGVAALSNGGFVATPSRDGVCNSVPMFLSDVKTNVFANDNDVSGGLRGMNIRTGLQTPSCARTLSILVLLVFFVAGFGFVFPHDVLADADTIEKPALKKIVYTEKEKQVMLGKLEDMNKNYKLKYGEYLTKKERMIRLEMIKKKYPINWYEKMMRGFDFRDCDGDTSDKRCAQGKLLCELTQEQIISVFLHYDDLHSELYSQMKEANINESDGDYPGYIDTLISTVIFIRIDAYIPARGYNVNYITSKELEDMIKNKLILNVYSKERLSVNKSNFLNQLKDLFGTTK